MNVIMFLVGLGIIGTGAAMWRYQLIHLLSNVQVEDVDETKKSALARFAGRYLILVGLVFLILGVLTGQILTEKMMLSVITGAVALIFLLTGLYLRGLRQFLKK